MATNTKSKVGSIRQAKRGEGWWELRVRTTHRDPTKPDRYAQASKTVGPMSERQARKALSAFQTELSQKNAKPAGATFNQLLDRFFETLATVGRADSTINTYKSMAGRWLRPAIGDVKVSRLTPEHFDAVYRSMVQAGRASATVNQVHAISRRACTLAVTWRWLESNPTRGTNRPSVHHRRANPPTPEQLLLLILAASQEDTSMGSLLQVSAGLGCRRGELCGLRWSDVRWNDNAISVVRSIDQVSYKRNPAGFAVKDTKTHQERAVNVGPTVMMALRRHLETVEERASWAGTTVEPSAYIFSREADGALPLRPDWVTAAFERARDQLELRGVRLQDLRHLKGTLMASAGVDLATIAEELGHSTPTTTLKFYAHAMPGTGAAAALKYDELLKFASLSIPEVAS